MNTGWRNGQKQIKLVTVGGFLGAGKTTTILRAISHLKAEGLTAVYITNDQGEGLVDTALGRANGVPVGEVIRGCFCCRFDELVRTVMRLVAEQQPNIVFAEAVGSCADLISTVVKPLRQHYGEQLELAPYTVMVDPLRFEDFQTPQVSLNSNQIDGVTYLFKKQIEEAQIVALNKVELLSENRLKQVREALERLAPSALLLPYSAYTGTNLDKLIATWVNEVDLPGRQPLDIDYDLYADAEAKLAWVNMTVQVLAMRSSGFYPVEWLKQVLEVVGGSVSSLSAALGHVKMQMDTAGGTTKVSLVRQGASETFNLQQKTLALSGQVLINARVETDPSSLRRSLEDAIKTADDAYETQSTIIQEEAFRPARPRPTHRLL